MDDDVIFVEAGSDWVALPATLSGSEGDLQTLITEHPELLGGAQMTPDNPRRFLLVAREIGIPDREAGPGRWSLDHLFVDQDAVPTFVEVKRAADPRIRRAVVGQMLDYAANGTKYWPVADVEAAFSATHSEPLDALTALCGEEAVPGFWEAVGRNLADGRIRLVFLADRIPHELRRIVEWLNEQTTNTEVLAVEIAHYGLPGRRALVPRVIGATAAAAETKRQGYGAGFEALLAAAPREVQEVYARFESWADELGVVRMNTNKARKYLAKDGIGLFLLYPDWKSIEVWIGAHRDTSEEIADRLNRALAAFTGHQPSPISPYVKCDLVLRQWDRWQDEILTPFTEGFSA